MSRKSVVIYHRCPACDAVLAAAKFAVTARRGADPDSKQLIRCPSCGHDAPPLAFPEIELPGETEQPEGRD